MADKVKIDCKSWYISISLIRRNLARIEVGVPTDYDDDPRGSLIIDTGDIGEVTDDELEEAVNLYRLFWRNGNPTDIALEVANAVRVVLSKYIKCKER